MKKTFIAALAFGIALFSTASIGAQAETGSESSANSTLKINRLDVEQSSLPGSTAKWSKLICDYTSAQKWTDGISFNFLVLVESEKGNPESRAIVSGGATYMNVPDGQSKAIMYLSPNATTRFGFPVSVKVELFKGDEIIGEKTWGKSFPKDWQELRQHNGMLKNVYATPWLLTDAANSPDLIVD